MNIREKQEQTELSLLSPYATRSIDTKGRRKPEIFPKVPAQSAAGKAGRASKRAEGNIGKYPV